jgi:hypothetical protein
MPPNRKAQLFAAIFAGFVVGACGLFQAREPLQPPPPATGCRALTGGPTAAVIPNTEEFYGRTSGESCYNSMLDTSFVFHPDGIDSSQALPSTPFIAWNDSVEARSNANIGSVQQFVNVAFQDQGSPIISPDGTTEVRFYQYQLRLRSVTTGPDTLRYTGLADITFHRGPDGQWRMTNWVDHRGGVTDSTWGILRAAFRL